MIWNSFSERIVIMTGAPPGESGFPRLSPERLSPRDCCRCHPAATYSAAELAPENVRAWQELRQDRDPPPAAHSASALSP